MSLAVTSGPIDGNAQQPADGELLRPVVPPNIRALLGPPSLTSLEDVDAYEWTLAQVAAVVSPQDFIEWAWVKDVVDFTWDAARARRAKVVRITMARRDAIEAILRVHQRPIDLDPILGDAPIPEMTDRVYPGHAREIKAFAKVLEHLGLTEQSVADAAFNIALSDFERLGQLAYNANSRRDAIRREIDRRREDVARRLKAAKQTIDSAVNTEFECPPRPRSQPTARTPGAAPGPGRLKVKPARPAMLFAMA